MSCPHPSRPRPHLPLGQFPQRERKRREHPKECRALLMHKQKSLRTEQGHHREAPARERPALILTLSRTARLC